MKGMILAAAMTFSGTVLAYTCEVEMVDLRTNRLITRIRANDYGDNCREGMKACRLEIRQRGLHGRADCVRVGDRFPEPHPRPLPDRDPRPLPDYEPHPRPLPGGDARRPISIGETVILQNRYVTIAGVSFNGLFAVRSTDGWNTISSNIPREQLAVTNGCNLGLCANDSVIDVGSARYVKIAGLSFHDRFVTQSTDGWNTLSAHLDRRQLAETKGCISSPYARLCVGNQVIDQSNRYMTIAGIQVDGRVVLRSTDGWNTLSTNVDPSRLVVTR
jgi:hypothetical protein